MDCFTSFAMTEVVQVTLFAMSAGCHVDFAHSARDDSMHFITRRDGPPQEEKRHV